MKTKNITFGMITTLVFLVSIFLFGEASALADCDATPGFVLDSSGVCVPSTTGLPDPGGTDPVADILINVMEWILGIFGVVAVIAFAISGLQYILSTGNDNVMETAKRNMTYSIIGVIVGLSGLLIIMAIDAMLNTAPTF